MKSSLLISSKKGSSVNSGNNTFLPLFDNCVKVEKILKGSLDSIPSPSPSVKIQIMGGKCVNAKHC